MGNSDFVCCHYHCCNQIFVADNLQAHCQSPTSQRYNQSFVKELAKPTHREKLFKKFAHTLKKIKNADTQADRKVRNLKDNDTKTE